MIYPIRKSFSNGVEKLQQFGWKRGVHCLPVAPACAAADRQTQTGFISRSMR
ncbi:MAG: hypothetical protein HZC45_08655 [Deltaproteobacteria bacterium]|nr:hypothetical protein [Deltaproteobacteria bacterium]